MCVCVCVCVCVTISLVIYLEVGEGVLERYLLIQLPEDLQTLGVKTRMNLEDGVKLELHLLSSCALCRFPSEKWSALGCNRLVFIITERIICQVLATPRMKVICHL